jgi:hypothetical protein
VHGIIEDGQREDSFDSLEDILTKTDNRFVDILEDTSKENTSRFATDPNINQISSRDSLDGEQVQTFGNTQKFN